VLPEVVGFLGMHPARRVTSKDVAERAGVSRTTVSLVLNHVPNTNISRETMERVTHAADELGYVPNAAAQALVNRNSGTVGLVLTRRNHTLATDAFFFQLVEGLLEALRQQGLRLLVDMVEDESNHSYLRLARSHQVDGILLSGPRYDDAALAALAQRKFPLVLNGTVAGGQFNTVDVDNIASARLAVEHLLRLGHRRIGCITNAPLTFTAASDRLTGYHQAMEGAGLAYDERLVGQGAFDPQSGYQQINRLLDQTDRPTAVFIASDVVAFGSLAALANRGLAVPRDMAVVGFDDVPMASYSIPQLTTVHLPTRGLAQAAGERLVELLQGHNEEPRQTLLQTHLIIRQSCGGTPHI
jgi:DNA-binding LacI/PurR family transcriptional regulator